jgi:lipoate-protein ligase B
MSPRCYVHKLEEAMIGALGEWGLLARRTEHTGVWVGDAKVAALGVQVTRGFTAHGFALNCDPDLGWFRHIVPCGIRDKSVASIASLRQSLSTPSPPAPVTVADAVPVVTRILGSSLGLRPAEPVVVSGVPALLASLGLQPAPEDE